MKRLLFVLALVAAAVLVGCRREAGWSVVQETIERQHPNVPQLSTDSLATWLADTAAGRPVLLDARSPEEYAVSHLQGAVRVDPGAEAFAFLDTLRRAGSPVVVYCSVGYRSSALAARIRAAGYADVYNLERSLFGWANEGRPVYRGGERVRAVHPYDAVWGRLLEEDLRAYEADTGVVR